MSKLVISMVGAVLAMAASGAFAAAHGGAMDDKAKAEKMEACKKMDPAKADKKMKADCKKLTAKSADKKK